MLSDIDMILFLDLTPKEDVKLRGYFASITDMFSSEIKFRFEEVEEVPSLFIFEMKLNKEITLDEIRDLVSGLFFNILE